MTVGTLSIASGGLCSGWAIDNVHHETSEQMNVRQTVYILADGSLLGSVIADQNNSGPVGMGYDSSHGYSFQLPSELLDGVTIHKIEAHGYDGKFASRTGVLS